MWASASAGNTSTSAAITSETARAERFIRALSPRPRRFPSLQAMDNPALILAGLAGGFTVGLTGMGGGALMTPPPLLRFKVEAKVAGAPHLGKLLGIKAL